MMPPAIKRHVSDAEANGTEAHQTPVQHGADVSAIHAAICDNCNKRINGIRHKCGSCVNYDMVRVLLLI